MLQDAANEKPGAAAPSRREAELYIPPAIADPEIETILGSYASKAKLAGFRKGMAPRDLVKRMFLAEIRQDAVETLVPKALDEELRSKNLRPVSVPVIQEAHFEEDGALHARVAFDIIPEFDMPAYRKIPIAKPAAVVEDKDVEAALEELRQRAVEYVPAEGRGVADGDYATVEIQGRDLKTKRFFPAEKSAVIAGSAGNDKELNVNLAGMKGGEQKTFAVAYPPDHPNRKLAGKTVEYSLKVQSIREKKVPSLDDELARTLGDTKDLADLKDKIRTALQASREKEARGKMASELLDKIAAGAVIDLPRSLIEEEARGILKRILSSYPQARLTQEQAAGLGTEARRQAEARVKNNIILTRIAETEGITVTDAEIQAELEALAEANHIPVAKVVETVDKEGRRGDIEENILYRKTIDFLMTQAIIG